MRIREMQFLRFLLLHLAMGMSVGWAVLAGILWFDVARLGSLLMGSPNVVEATAMLLVVFAVTFGGAAMGSAIMSLGPDEDHGDDDRSRRVRLVRRADGRVVQFPTD